MKNASSNSKIAPEAPANIVPEKLMYDRNALLKIRELDLSKKRPESLPNLEVVLDGPVMRVSYDKWN